MYIARKNAVIEQAEQIREERKKLQTRILEKQKVKKAAFSGLQVPKYIQSSKHIMAEKKEAQKGMGSPEKKKK